MELRYDNRQMNSCLIAYLTRADFQQNVHIILVLEEAFEADNVDMIKRFVNFDFIE
jgi:hypothetical protein